MENILNKALVNMILINSIYQKPLKTSLELRMAIRYERNICTVR